MTDYILFGLFAATLIGIARYHKYAVHIAVSGLIAILIVRLTTSGGEYIAHHFAHEWKELVNLGGLLLGFALLADYFERSNMPEKLAELLPAGKMGPFLLLLLIAVLSALLDNIAAALIGGAAAVTLFKRRLHIGYLAAMVAASNAGGAGSVIGDTTTTMIWIGGASPLWVVEAAIGAIFAIGFFGIFASAQQNSLQPLVKIEEETPPVDKLKLVIVGRIIVGTISTNILYSFPAAGVWAAILLGGLFSKPNWKALPHAAHGMFFLISLVAAASMMPVEKLPAASEWTALGLGFVSAFFDNIPLTKLAILQDNYDWGILAYTVGYGGSMLWFGSSAGVALAGLFTEAKSIKQWIIHGWHVPVGYVIGFFAMLWIVGWHPHPIKGDGTTPASVHGEAPGETGHPGAGETTPETGK
ncbi:MAG: SLC13 family permease [Planctomycetota bacterium]